MYLEIVEYNGAEPDVSIYQHVKTNIKVYQHGVSINLCKDGQAFTQLHLALEMASASSISLGYAEPNLRSYPAWCELTQLWKIATFHGKISYF